MAHGPIRTRVQIENSSTYSRKHTNIDKGHCSYRLVIPIVRKSFVSYRQNIRKWVITEHQFMGGRIVAKDSLVQLRVLRPTTIRNNNA